MTYAAPEITLDPQVLSGKPVIAGARLSVEFVIGLMADGWSEAEIVGNYYPALTADRIRAVVESSAGPARANCAAHAVGANRARHARNP
jgi:uncharacterized protein (DUF433 family)